MPKKSPQDQIKLTDMIIYHAQKLVFGELRAKETWERRRKSIRDQESQTEVTKRRSVHYSDDEILDILQRAKYDAGRKKGEYLISTCCRPAAPHDWIEFLDARKSPCTHFYKYPLPSDFYVAEKDFIVPSIGGVGSFNVIVPKGINVEHEGSGPTSCHIYRLEDPDAPDGWVPAYVDAYQTGSEKVFVEKIKEERALLEEHGIFEDWDYGSKNRIHGMF